MIKQFKILMSAFMFFTRIRVPDKWTSGVNQLSKIAMYLPLVGWFVGGISALVFYLANQLLSVEISVILSMISSILITGALHEDGLADVCDAFGGAWDKTNILRIMKDSSVGVFAVIGLVIALFFKFTLLTEIPLELIVYAIIIAHSLSRTAAVGIIYFYKYVRETDDSKSKEITKKSSFLEFVVAIVIGILPILLLGNVFYFIILFVVLITVIIFMCYCKKWIGGYTGDVLGATQQITEIVIYLSIILISLLITL